MNNAYIRAQQLKVKEAKFPFVKIGSQYWTTKNLSLSVTPQGNTIPEMQANGNVEKVINGGFDTDTAWIKGAGWIIANGKASHTGTGTTIDETPGHLTVGGWFKVTFQVLDYVSGNIGINGSVIPGGYYVTSNGIYTRFIKSESGQLSFYSNGSAAIDNISVQGIGWAGSQELYDGIYAQTSGTVEQKTYAAVKAAAMWSNYNNDAPTGLIYGKILNGFARRLINMDIAYYNAANPTKPYVWALPIKVQIQLLATNGGNSLKAIGTTYLNDANGTNATGFNAYGSGKRNTDGTFSGLKSNALFWIIGTNEVLQLESANNNATVISASEVEGYAIRLIKA